MSCGKRAGVVGSGNDPVPAGEPPGTIVVKGWTGIGGGGEVGAGGGGGGVVVTLPIVAVELITPVEIEVASTSVVAATMLLPLSVCPWAGVDTRQSRQNKNATIIAVHGIFHEITRVIFIVMECGCRVAGSCTAGTNV